MNDSERRTDGEEIAFPELRPACGWTQDGGVGQEGGYLEDNEGS